MYTSTPADLPDPPFRFSTIWFRDYLDVRWTSGGVANLKAVLCLDVDGGATAAVGLG